MVLLSALALVTGCAFAAETYTGTLVDKYTSGAVQKEANLRKKVADQQKAQENKAVQLDKKIQAKQDKVNKKIEKKQEEINKKAKERQAAREAKKKDIQKKVEAKKKAWYQFWAVE